MWCRAVESMSKENSPVMNRRKGYLSSTTDNENKLRSPQRKALSPININDIIH